MATSAVLGGSSGLSYQGPAPAKIGRILGVIVAMIGLAALVGWLLRLPGLTSIVPGWASMKANTAIGLTLSGVALLLAAAGRAPWARAGRLALGGLILALGAATLVEYAFGWPLGIDELLVRDSMTSGTAWPGRPSSIAAINFVLAGAALLALEVGNGWRIRPSESLSLAMGLLAFVSVQGYVFGQESLSHVPAFSTVGLNTVVGFIALAAGLFIVRPGAGLMANIMADGIGGAALRGCCRFRCSCRCCSTGHGCTASGPATSMRSAVWRWSAPRWPLA